MTIWKTLKQNDNYEISNQGEIRNKSTDEILVGDRNSVGYRRVILYYGPKQRHFIHRLVASYFCEGEQESLVVNHIDGDRLNNSADNLEWITRSENDKHAFKLGLRKVNNLRGVAQLDPDTREVIKIYDTVATARAEHPKAGTNISTVCTGGRQLAGGYRWEYT